MLLVGIRDPWETAEMGDSDDGNAHTTGIAKYVNFGVASRGSRPTSRRAAFIGAGYMRVYQPPR